MTNRLQAFGNMAQDSFIWLHHVEDVAFLVDADDPPGSCFPLRLGPRQQVENLRNTAAHL